MIHSTFIVGAVHLPALFVCLFQLYFLIITNYYFSVICNGAMFNSVFTISHTQLFTLNKSPMPLSLQCICCWLNNRCSDFLILICLSPGWILQRTRWMRPSSCSSLTWPPLLGSHGDGVTVGTLISIVLIQTKLLATF